VHVIVSIPALDAHLASVMSHKKLPNELIEYCIRTYLEDIFSSSSLHLPLSSPEPRKPLWSSVEALSLASRWLRTLVIQMWFSILRLDFRRFDRDKDALGYNLDIGRVRCADSCAPSRCSLCMTGFFISYKAFIGQNSSAPARLLGPISQSFPIYARCVAMQCLSLLSTTLWTRQSACHRSPSSICAGSQMLHPVC
jgi:hypothetical protein